MTDEVLKCDADGCDHVEAVGTITQAMVDMACPKCGANLLTMEDWLAWEPIQQVMRAFEGLNLSGVASVNDKLAMRVGLHGSKTTIEIEPVDNGKAHK